LLPLPARSAWRFADGALLVSDDTAGVIASATRSESRQRGS
jgi:hypothetical protein